MPTYEYRCTNCGNELEAVQSFSEPALTECPQCGENALRKLFGNVGVVFKGSGFYRNDSRSDAKSSPAATKEKADTSGATDAKPAAKKDSTATAGADSSAKTTKSTANKPATGSGT